MSNPEKYTVGWICAINTELVAAEAFFDEEHEQLETMADKDENAYSLGRIGRHNVVMAVLPASKYGTTSAANVARDMVRSFPNIRFGLMVGIGGGAPSKKHDIRLGDVVVSEGSNGQGGVYQYAFGKAIQGQEFVTTGHLNGPPQLLLRASNQLKAQYKRKGNELSTRIDEVLEKWPRLRREFSRPPPDSDKLYRSEVVHPDSSKECGDVCSNDPGSLVARRARDNGADDPAIHYGVIASADQLMKDALVRDKMAESMDVLCFEMEAAGLMDSFPCIVIRGICDYSDSHKNKVWQGFAAMMAAAYAKDVLNKIPPNTVEAEKPIRELLSSIESTVNKANGAVMSMASDHQFAQIKQWLSPSDYSTIANSARDRRHDGTGTWLLNSPIFQEWKLGSRRHLWLYGLTGCGKTVLSTAILDHLRQIDTHTTLAFFFHFNDPKKLKLDDLQRSLAVQLYSARNEAGRVLDSLFNSHSFGQTQPDTTVLSATIKEMIKITGKVFVIIDALDECTTRGELLQWIRDLTSTNAQILATGQPKAEFQREFPHLFCERNCVELNKQAINADIRSYVHFTLEHDPRFVHMKLSQGILDETRDKIGDGADGMFRWAACQLDSLARCRSPRDVKNTLRSLPHDLNETYSRILQNIPSKYNSGAIRLLQFLVYAKRPLRLPEAIEVLATEIDEEPRGFDVAGRLFRKEDIKDYCPSLVEIVKATRYDKIVEEQLHLAHFSVKEYLLEQARFDLESASNAITRTCLTYLGDIKTDCLRDIKNDHRTIRSSFPMARYAGKYWTGYACSAGSSEEIVRRTVTFLKDETAFKLWCHLSQANFCWIDESEPPAAPRLYHACSAGLTGAAKDLITEGADVNAKGGKYGNALQAASYNGHLDIVQMLLDKEADINTQGGEYSYALLAAALRGRRQIMQILLDKGADVNAQGGFYGNSLHAAIVGGDTKSVKMLLDKGADVTIQCGYYGNALQAASCSGQQEIVQILLDKGADVNMQGGEFSNALQAASYFGWQEIVQMLLDKGADVNMQGGELGNALQAASYSGQQEIMQMLLDKGADVNMQGGEFSNALQAALYHGRQEIVQMLLDKGADVNMQGGGFSNALHAALYRGNPRIVQMLLDKGADVHIQGGVYGNALQAASRSGDITTMQMILEKGADVNAKGGKYGNSLLAASRHVSSEVSQLLISNGANLLQLEW